MLLLLGRASDLLEGDPCTDKFSTNHGPCLHDKRVHDVKSSDEEENEGEKNTPISHPSPPRRVLLMELLCN